MKTTSRTSLRPCLVFNTSTSSGVNTCEVKEMNEGIAMRIKNRDIKRTTLRLRGDKWLRRPPPVACGCGESENMSSSFLESLGFSFWKIVMTLVVACGCGESERRCLLPFFRIVWFFDLEFGDDTRGHITLIVKSLSCCH